MGKYGSPVLSAAKVINQTVALVFMLALETVMLAPFGTADDAGFQCRIGTTKRPKSQGVSIKLIG